MKVTEFIRHLQNMVIRDIRMSEAEVFIKSPESGVCTDAFEAHVACPNENTALLIISPTLKEGQTFIPKSIGVN